MKEADLLEVCLLGIENLDEKKRRFVLQCKAQLRGKRPRPLTDPQYQYLSDCYDALVSEAYGLEPVA